MRKKVTLSDVAKEANVSPATVSYVLNNVTKQKIPHETKVRVFEAASKLNYVQNMNARALAGGKTNVIGALLVGTPNEYVSKHISYAKFLDQLEGECNRLGYRLMVARIDPQRPEVNIIAERKLDGVFLVDASEDSFHRVSEQFEYGSPVVLVDGIVDDPLFCNLIADYRQAFSLLEQSLQGREFAVIRERYHNRRLGAFIREASDLPEERIYVAEKDDERLRAFLEAQRQRGRLVVVLNEFLALHVLKYCPPEQVVAVCTAECPEYLPEATGRIYLQRPKALVASDIMQHLLTQPFTSHSPVLHIPFEEQQATEPLKSKL